jgi:uncharacterized membrane protein
MPVQLPENRNLLRQRLQATRDTLASLVDRARLAKQTASSPEIATLADLILDLARANLEALRLLREAQRRGVS